MKPSFYPNKQSLQPNKEATEVVQKINGKDFSTFRLQNYPNDFLSFICSNFKYILIACMIILVILVGKTNFLQENENVLPKLLSPEGKIINFQAQQIMLNDNEIKEMLGPIGHRLRENHDK